ncbi:MAG: hypothetical protein JWM42_66 [Burkholderia sp.]|nr:hypothetical protein [Burkholderia sp.]
MSFEQSGQLLSVLRRHLIELTCHFAVDASDPRMQHAQHTAHAFVLPRTGISSNLARQLRCLPVIALPQAQMPSPRGFHQMLPAAFQQR